jgi:protein translocase, SecG subunit
MYTVITILVIIVSILLTGIVLIQNSKGGGLAANFASGNQTFGVRQTADFLEKATWILAITLIVLCILLTAFISTGRSERQNAIQQRIEQQAPVQGQPEFPTIPPVSGTQPDGGAATEGTVPPIEQ